MNISAYMTQPVISARPDEGVRTAFFRMRERGIRHLPVLDGEQQILGWISDRDIRRPDWVDPDHDTSFGYRLEDDLLVKDLMTTNVVAVHTYDPVEKAVAIILDRKYGALPVVDKTGACVGVLSAVDLVRTLRDLLEASALSAKVKS